MIARLLFSALIAAFVSPPTLAAAEVELHPGLLAKPYRKVLVAPPNVEFDRRFLEDTQSLRGARHGRARTQAAEEIAREFGRHYQEALAEAFREQGFEVVPVAAGDVLTLSPSLVDVYVNRPTDPPVTFNYLVREAGEAGMVVEGRDASGSRVLVAKRQGKAGETAAHQAGSDAFRRAGFQAMFRAWAQDVASAVAQASRPAR